ncbi:MAG: response regulator transcription factor [Lachnospiraceae bacterium]|nr:response regulator transcription factor [Lachnospiraceae bacterium]
MTKIAVCDDRHTDETGKIRKLLIKLKERADEEWEVSYFNSGGEVLEASKQTSCFDVYILGAEAEGVSGVEVARIIRDDPVHPKVVIVSDKKDYCFDAFQAHVCRYLLKPIDEAEFAEAVDIAIKGNKYYRDNRTFKIKTGTGLRRIEFRDLLYVESLSRVMVAHTVKGERVESVCLRKAFEKEAEELILSGAFLQPHKSYIVNMDYIDSLKTAELVLTTGEHLRISKNRHGYVKKTFADYLEKRNV